MKKILLVVTLLVVIFPFIGEAKGQSYLYATFDILNDPTFGYHESQYAPSTLRLVFYAYSQTDRTPTRFRFDCTSDGSYDADVTLASDYPSWNSFPVVYIGNGYTIQGGQYWRYIQPTSPWPAWWAQDTSGSLAKCYYPLEGDYTITMLAERGGVQVTSTKSFNLRAPAVDMIAKPLYKGNIIEDVYPNSDMETGRGGQSRMNIPQPTAVVDFGVSIWNPLPPEFPLKPSSGAIKFDCDSDGVYEKTDSYPRAANSNQGDYFCDYFSPWTGGAPDCLGSFDWQLSYYPSACVYDKPGVYRATVRAELDRTGAAPYVRDTSTEFPVVSKNSATVSFSTGSDPKQASAPLKGVDLKLDVANVVWAHTSYNFDCGNGQATSKSVNADFAKRYYDQDYSTVVKDYCNYDNPGEYTVKAQAEFRPVNFPGGIDFIRNTLPAGGGTVMFFNGNYSGGGGDFKLTGLAGNYLTYNVQKQFKILVTGKVSDTEYVVTSPFDLKWDASRVSSCTVTGVGNNLSATGTGSKTVGVSVPAGDYSYKLNCTSSSGVSIEKVIKVKVIAP